MPVSVASDSGLTVITLDRPDVLNAFDDELGREALKALRHASEDEETRCIVITGAGRAFSSGEDLGALADGYEDGEVPDLGAILLDRYNPLIKAIRAAPKPVVAALNGVAAGAGASIALACDLRIASDRAKLVFSFTQVGLVPDSGALWFLSRMVGAARAMEFAMAGSSIDARQALDIGLISRVVAADEFEEGWRAFALELAAGPTVALGLTKRLVHSSAGRSLEEQLSLETDAQMQAGKTQDHLEGVRAFLAKRSPRFEGR
jgi:2-(1,2-epoxy-1,2-dihydrophenyl)acetyl-CoA isomerase